MHRTVGLLGGGQLGQMLCEVSNPLGINVVILDAENSPAKQVNAKVSHINGSFKDPEKIRELASRVDILTVETEHVNTFVLEEIAEKGIVVQGQDGTTQIKKVEVQPSWRTIRVIQDKFDQKQHLLKNGVNTAKSRAVSSQLGELEAHGQKFGFPFMLKTRKEAYDGRGNYPIRTAESIPKALQSLHGKDLYVEEWIDFQMELAVMVAKYEDGVTSDGHATIAYPAVETTQQDSICKLVYAPARGVSDDILLEAQKIARKAVGSLWGRGIFGVELFLLRDGSLVVNEIAPRPHNSGHYTIEACPTFSQFKSHLLSVLGIMPLIPNARILPFVPSTIMLNILGGATKTSHDDLVKAAMAMPSAAIHMYGKESKPGRKIGHITVVATTMSQAENLIEPLISLVDSIRAER
ncbi:phosphoribosylaminoimidazole carboxylase [Podosphaera aphanis]|nr:phosphoribosylaminoimidazole carboxylase [Podosphaera aphanis]